MMNRARRRDKDFGTSEDRLLRVHRRMDRLVSPRSACDSLSPFWGDDAASYHLAYCGRHIRARLAIGACQAVGLSDEDMVAIAAAVELLHNASLIHDDLQDRDRLRRGQEAVWARYGVNTAICAGDLLISASFASIASLSRIECLAEAIMRVHERIATAIRGQGADLSFQAKSIENVSVYEAIAEAKSGALLGLPLELAFIAAGREEWCDTARNAANAFAIGYQIADDIEDTAWDRSLNIISVLKDAGVSDPRAKAARRAQALFVEAARLGTLLPDGSGTFLVELCEQLSTHLIDENEMACTR